MIFSALKDTFSHYIAEINSKFQGSNGIQVFITILMLRFLILLLEQPFISIEHQLKFQDNRFFIYYLYFYVKSSWLIALKYYRYSFRIIICLSAIYKTYNLPLDVLYVTKLKYKALDIHSFLIFNKHSFVNYDKQQVSTSKYSQYNGSFYKRGHMAQQV